MMAWLNIRSLLLAPCLAASVHAAWSLTQPGTTGVGAMQIAVVSLDTVLIIDKLEQNPLRDADGKHAWGAVYSLKTNTARPIKLVTNSFCAGGGWLSNGTMVNLGGNPLVEVPGVAAPNGLQGVRLYNPCAENENCDMYESPNRIRLTSARWYPSGARLSDGSLLIFGGAFGGGWTNFKELNNPTYEFYPPKNINGFNGLQIPSKFLEDTLPHNLFPHVNALPNGQVFVAANNKSMMLDWQRNIETRLPDLPNGQRVTYPMSGAGVMLPLRYENNYAADILLCGGSEVSDTIKENELSATQTPASAQCARMTLNSKGIKRGWQVEKMPGPRMMPEGVILPDGKVLIINGAATGTAGYGNLQNQVGLSNADNPVLQPVLYDPDAPVGKRFSSEGVPTSNIPRMYHSVATLLPSGAVLIAGSNPNEDVTDRPYGTEFRTEILFPEYMTMPRPTIVNFPQKIRYTRGGSITVSFPLRKHKRWLFKKVDVVLMDLGFATHGVHMDQRMVTLPAVMIGRKLITFTGPPNPNVYPPGPAFLFVVVDGIPSVAQKVMIGDGRDPPVDQGAINNMLAKTGNPIN